MTGGFDKAEVGQFKFGGGPVESGDVGEFGIWVLGRSLDFKDRGFLSLREIWSEWVGFGVRDL